MELSRLAGLISFIVAVYSVALWFLATRYIIRSVCNVPKEPTVLHLVIEDKRSRAVGVRCKGD